MKTYKTSFFMISMGIILLLTSCVDDGKTGPSSIRSGDEEKAGPLLIRVGTQDHFGSIVAKGLGYWEDVGVPIEFKTYPGGGPEAMSAFLNGELDIAYLGFSAALWAIDQEPGEGHKIVASDHTNLLSLGVRTENGSVDPSINPWLGAASISDFNEANQRPMKIIVWGSGPGSSNWAVLVAWLMANGLDYEKDVDIICKGLEETETGEYELPFREYLSTGQADAAALVKLIDDVLALLGWAKPVEWISKTWAESISEELAPCCVVLVRGGFIKSWPGLVKKVLGVHLKAFDYMLKPDSDWPLIWTQNAPPPFDQLYKELRWFLESSEETANAYLNMMAPVFKDTLHYNPHKIENSTLELLKVLKEVDFIEGDLTSDDIFDFSFYDEVGTR